MQTAAVSVWAATLFPAAEVTIVRQMNKTSKTTLGGITAALSVVIMLMTVVPVMTYVAPMVAGALLIIIVIEADRKWAYAIFAVAAILSMLLAADKEAAMLYIMFFGHYPVTKAVIESKIKSRVLEYIVKFAVFNITTVSAYLIIVKVLMLPMDDMNDLGKYAWLILLAAGNIMFPIYDITLSKCILLYDMRIRKILRKLFK